MNGGVRPSLSSCPARWLDRIAAFLADEGGVESTEIAVVMLVMAGASAASTQAMRDTIHDRVRAFAERLQDVHPGD